MKSVTMLVAFGAVGLVAAASDFPDGAPRYWPKFGGNRDVSLLDGTWDYGYIDGWNSGFDSMSPTFTPSQGKTPNSTAVPSCMDVVAGGAPGYLGPRGVAMYRTKFATPSTGVAPMRLQFQACSFYCRVWVNGKEVGDHRAGGYVAFSLDVPAGILDAGADNELFVLADNRWNATTAPVHTGGDFWAYGGLMRSVEVHTMAEKPVLWRAYVATAGADATKETTTMPSAVDITLQLSSAEDAGSTVDFTVAFDGGAAVSHSGAVAEDGTVSLKAVTVPAAKLWSPAEPNLHTVTVAFRLGEVTERFGLRSFGTDPKTARLTINGKATKLVGWNHHTQWPVTAASPTDGQMDADVVLLKQGNANYVRGAHYPHDPRWMDRLDEAGIVFWSETLGPGVSTENLQDPVFMKFQIQQLAEMMDNAMNHASVMTWGWFNEGPTNDPAACPGYGQCNDYARARDPVRFTTFADDWDTGGQCFQHATLISFNNYPSWYNSAVPANQWNTFANDVRAGQTSSGPSGTAGKPFTISETGAGGIFEFSNNATDVKWTLQYQAGIIAADVDVALSNENVSGITLWHFYDFKVDNCAHSGAREAWPCMNHGVPYPGQENNTHCEYDHPPPTTFAALAKEGPPNCTYIDIDNRPGGENHKGTLDFWRRPKPVFHIVAKKYATANTKTNARSSISPAGAQTAV